MKAGIFRKIIASVDGSRASEKALTYAMQLAQDHGAELAIVHVIADTKTGALVEYGTKHGGMSIVNAFYQSAANAALKWLKPLESNARKQGVDAKTEILWELGKTPTDLIVKYAKENGTDLIVIGTRGLGGFRRLLLGSVASGVISRSSCVVMVVR